MVDRLTAPKKRRTTSSRNFRLYAEEPVKGEPEPDDENIGDFDPTKPMMSIEYVTLDNLHDILVAEIPEHPEIGRVREAVININFRIKAIKSMVQNLESISSPRIYFMSYKMGCVFPKVVVSILPHAEFE